MGRTLTVSKKEEPLLTGLWQDLSHGICEPGILIIAV